MPPRTRRRAPTIARMPSASSSRANVEPRWPGQLAAIDMGSNSFRLEVGQLAGGRYRRVDYLKETVRLGGGLDAAGFLSEEAATRGLECLARFARRLDGFLPTQVRAVATQTLREARNRDAFLLRAQTVLGHSIEIISGREEARLIFAGVARLQPSTVPRLVVDIGGRSTEMIVGRGTRPRQAESFQVGSVSLSMKYFPEGRFSEHAFREAQIAAGAELEEALAPFAPRHWKEALGSSGTVGAVSQVLAASGISDGRITPAGLRWLMERCLEAGSADRLALPGLKSERRVGHRRRPVDPLHAGDAFRHRRAQAGARRAAPGRDLRPRRAPGGRAQSRWRGPARGVGARAAAALPGRRRAGGARRSMSLPPCCAIPAPTRTARRRASSPGRRRCTRPA